jgi:hypothetical protein
MKIKALATNLHLPLENKGDTFLNNLILMYNIINVIKVLIDFFYVTSGNITFLEYAKNICQGGYI